MGAGGLRGGARRLARRRRLAGNARSLVAPRDEGPHDCIEWAGAALVERQGRLERHLLLRDERVAGGPHPPHLAAFCAWEGSPTITARRYGGTLPLLRTSRAPCIACSTAWASAGRRAVTGEPVCGYDRIPEEELRQNRIDYEPYIHEHALEDELPRALARLEQGEAPFLSAANWGGQGLHTRGNFEGFMHAASRDKWLEAHGGAHWEGFYTRDGERLQKRFFGHFLKGEDTAGRSSRGWS